MKTYKSLLLTLAFIFFIGSASAQMNVGIGTNSPAASAGLDITAAGKGLLIPRMTSAVRNLIDAPAKGLLVYDSTANELYYYDGAVWQAVDAPAPANLTLPFATFSGPIGLGANDHTVRSTGAGGNVTLPPAGTCTGRIYRIIAGSNIILSPGVIGYSGNSISLLNTGTAIVVQSNGSSWFQVP